MEMVMDIWFGRRSSREEVLLCGADGDGVDRVRAFPPKLTASWKELPAISSTASRC